MAIDLTQHHEASLAVVETLVNFDDPIRIAEDAKRIGKVEASHAATSRTLGLVPFELHDHDIGQRTTTTKRAATIFERRAA